MYIISYFFFILYERVYMLTVSRVYCFSPKKQSAFVFALIIIIIYSFKVHNFRLRERTLYKLLSKDFSLQWPKVPTGVFKCLIL